MTDALSLMRAPGRPTTASAGFEDPDAIAARALTVARRTALGVLADRETAADVAQEVAITAVRKAASVRDPAALDAWIHRVAVRAALREARRGHSRREAEVAHQSLRAPAGEGDQLAELLSLLAGLPPRQRAALTLRYVHDLSDQAIASALRCRPGTVRALLSRGRDSLRAADQKDLR